MADIGIFFDAATRAELPALTLDVIESIEHQDTGTATDNPVGAQLKPISDNFINAPTMLTITGVVSDHVPGLPSRPGRSRDVWRALLNVKRSALRVGFVSGLEVFQNGLIESVSGGENVENEEAATLVITYKVIETATAAVSELPAAAVATKKGRKRGGQATKTASAAKAEEGSILYEAFFRE